MCFPFLPFSFTNTHVFHHERWDRMSIFHQKLCKVGVVDDLETKQQLNACVENLGRLRSANESSTVLPFLFSLLFFPLLLQFDACLVFCVGLETYDLALLSLRRKLARCRKRKLVAIDGCAERPLDEGDSGFQERSRLRRRYDDCTVCLESMHSRSKLCSFLFFFV